MISNNLRELEYVKLIKTYKFIFQFEKFTIIIDNKNYLNIFILNRKKLILKRKIMSLLNEQITNSLKKKNLICVLTNQRKLIFDIKSSKYILLNELTKEEILSDFIIIKKNILKIITNIKVVFYDLLTFKNINFEGINNAFMTDILDSNKFLIIRNSNLVFNFYDKENYEKIDMTRFMNKDETEINNYIETKNFIVIQNNLYDYKNLNKIQFKEIYKNDKISSIQEIKKLLIIKVNDKNYFIYNILNLKRFEITEFKKKYDITYFYFSNNYFILEINKNQNLIYDINNFRKINFNNKNKNTFIKSVSIFNDILKIENNLKLNSFYDLESLKKIEFLKKNEIFYIEELKHFLKIDIDSNIKFFKSKSYELIKFLGVKKNDLITNYNDLKKYFSLQINRKYNLLYDVMKMKKINFKGINQNDYITDINIFKNLIKVEINNEKTLIFSSKTYKLIKRFCENDLLNSEIIDNRYFIIFKNITNYRIFNINNYEEIYFKKLKKNEKISKFNLLKNNILLEVNHIKYYLFDLKKLKLIRLKFLNENDKITNFIITKFNYSLQYNLFNWLFYEKFSFKLIKMFGLKNKRRITNFDFKFSTFTLEKDWNLLRHYTNFKYQKFKLFLC